MARITCIIRDQKYKGGVSRWRGPIGTPEEKQEQCLFAMRNFPMTCDVEGRTEYERFQTLARLRHMKSNGTYPPIDCVRRCGYWLLSFEVQ